MTNCYICGSPILEGQRSVPETTVWHGRTGKVEDQPSHLNPADHLPTGFKTLQKQYAEALGQAYLKEDVRIEERERAAKIVEEFHAQMVVNEIPPEDRDLRWNEGWDAALAWIVDLPERIRNGD